MHNNKKVLAVIEDLFFLVQVKDTAKKAGLEFDFARNLASAIEKACAGDTVLIVIDLNAAAVGPLDVIRGLKADPRTQAMPILAFVPHVQVDLRRAAEEAGADRVLARSAFAQELAAAMRSV